MDALDQKILNHRILIQGCEDALAEASPNTEDYFKCLWLHRRASSALRVLIAEAHFKQVFEQGKRYLDAAYKELEAAQATGDRRLIHQSHCEISKVMEQVAIACQIAEQQLNQLRSNTNNG